MKTQRVATWAASITDKPGGLAAKLKTLAAGGVLPSDGRLPIQPLDHRALDCVEGRILVHGEQEDGRAYMMLESTDGKIYAINHTRQMEGMRNRGGLRVNSFVRLRKLLVGGRARIEVEELGTAESILENRGYLRQIVKGLARRGAIPVDQGWGGWLGRYQRAVRRAANELQPERDRIGIGR